MRRRENKDAMMLNQAELMKMAGEQRAAETQPLPDSGETQLVESGATGGQTQPLEQVKQQRERRDAMALNIARQDVATATNPRERKDAMALDVSALRKAASEDDGSKPKTRLKGWLSRLGKKE